LSLPARAVQRYPSSSIPQPTPIQDGATGVAGADGDVGLWLHAGHAAKATRITEVLMARTRHRAARHVPRRFHGKRGAIAGCTDQFVPLLTRSGRARALARRRGRASGEKAP
jgi:hypothetical protein